jgi:CheY-like chemotaxis protein
MTPVEANVFFVEDNEDSLNTSREFLEQVGHHIVETALSRTEALQKIPGLRAKGVNVAIVDGNLSDDDVSGNDGQEITAEIKKIHNGEIKVIGHSFSDPIPNADFNSTKAAGAKALIDAVTKA